MDQPDLYLLTVFGGQRCPGNATSIIVSRVPVEEKAAQRLAARIATPDTGFLYPSPGGGSWMLASYSPVEMLAYCTQTILAAGKILRDFHAAGPDVRLVIPQTGREAAVECRREEGSDTCWTPVNADDVRMHPMDTLVPGLNRPDGCRFPTMLIDTGRPRAVIKLAHPKTLYRFRPDPEDILAFCRGSGINGLCLFSHAADGHILARVFTTSLEGREDRGTGGAIACIPHYLRAIGETGTHLKPTLVRQGGRGADCGMMMVRTEADRVWIGSQVALFSVGRLTQPL